MGDDDYRAWIDVGIRLNIGSGTPEDVLAIISILCGKKPNVLMHEYGHDAIFTFLALPKTPLKAFFAIIQSAARSRFFVLIHHHLLKHILLNFFKEN
jgi:hypothetical protein